MNTNVKKKQSGTGFSGKVIHFALYLIPEEFMWDWGGQEMLTKIGSFSVHVLFRASLHLNRILREDLGVLTSLGWAPDGHCLILAKADLKLLCMKPGGAPSEIW